MISMSATQISKAICIAALIAASPVALSSAMAQTEPSPSTTAPAEKAAPPEVPAPAATATTPPAAAPAPATKTAAAVPANDVAVGSVVFGSDGKRLGKIDAVKADAGSVAEIHVHVGGLFGFGGKTVSVPGDKITKTGETIQIGLTSEEVDKLPEVGKSSG